MIKKYMFVITLLVCLFLFGCAATKSGEFESSRDGRYKSDSLIPSGEIDGVIAAEPIEGKGENKEETPQAGQLTASVYFDNDRFSYWKGLLTSNQEGDGIFLEYSKLFAFKTLNRIKISFPGVAGARVTVDNFTGTTDTNGDVYLFVNEEKDEYSAQVNYINSNNEVITKEFTVKNNESYVIEDSQSKKNIIELMFVIDTTGSMGDEMNYLKSEIDDVINRVKNSNEGVDIKLALLFYRDQGDEYITRYFDFTTDVDSQKNNLALQDAAGGGDYEEAVTVALGEAINKQWTTTSETRIIVHVADAPAHDSDIDNWNEIACSAAKKGIRIIMVASSGIDKKTEYFFRCQCIITGGAYGYLTNDSGIGGDHIEATTEEEMVVEYLNAMLVRLINGYHTGKFADAVSWRNVNE